MHGTVIPKIAVYPARGTSIYALRVPRPLRLRRPNSASTDGARLAPTLGIATVTVMFDGSVRYAETTGKAGVLPAGGVERMRAGNGVWHTGAPEPGRVKGFQLWVALPPELENAANASHYVMPEEVPVDGPVRVILGAYRKARSPTARRGDTSGNNRVVNGRRFPR